MSRTVDLWTLADVHQRFADIEVATLTTVDEHGTLSSRPMKLQRFDGDATLWFVANHTAEWVAGCHGAAVNVSLQDDRGWASFAGHLELLRNAHTVAEFHDPSRSRIDRSDAAVLRCDTEEIEWWAQPSAGAELIGKLVELFTDGDPPSGSHGSIRLPAGSQRG